MRNPQIAFRYDVDGSVTKHDPIDGRKFTLKELQQLVGGYLEVVICENHRQHAYVDEEGALKSLPPNPNTWSVLKRDVYEMNGYSSKWRVAGPIVVVVRSAV